MLLLCIYVWLELGRGPGMGVGEVWGGGGGGRVPHHSERSEIHGKRKCRLKLTGKWRRGGLEEGGGGGGWHKVR